MALVNVLGYEHQCNSFAHWLVFLIPAAHSVYSILHPAKHGWAYAHESVLLLEFDPAPNNSEKLKKKIAKSDKI
ncbi:hypothetical protein B5C26_07385 [Photorhabdus luminescens]|uniref:hypothetical protein n=1 Tax=Photorhabdus luminescens TaxID=29488 RepID=UPI000B4CDD60|nr:hypothetical protein [Photorhabdus luminescens]OWO83409.1 hypothetical protein B5C26_07385 [Photorhabdus luminescens]